MMDTIDISLNINDPETIERFDGLYVDFYLEDDMFELEGQFFTLDGQLYIEFLSSRGVLHMAEMAGKELRMSQIGKNFYATRPDGKRFYSAINRVYYKVTDPKPEDFKEYLEKGVDEFFLLMEDISVNYVPETKKWTILKNKIDMTYIGDVFEHDSIEELCAEHAEDMKGEWEFCIYEAYEEESDFASSFFQENPYLRPTK